MSEANTPAPAASNFSTNLLLLIGIIAISGSIIYVGQGPAKAEQEVEDSAPTVTEMTLGDDFWLNLPPEVAAMRDKLAEESLKLANLSEPIADKIAKLQELEEGDEAEKLGDEVEAVIGEQQKKVRLLQRDYVRRINGLRSTYIAKNMTKRAQ